MSHSKSYTINELAQCAHVSRRTIRYYVQRGLLAPPNGKGRGSYYTSTHLRHLLYIRDQQLKGIALDQIKIEQSPPLNPSSLSSSRENHSTSIYESPPPSLAGSSDDSLHQDSLTPIHYPTTHWVQITLNPDVCLNLRAGTFDPQHTQELCQLIQTFIKKQSGEC